MSPKKFRKISHPELEISLNLSNFSKKVSQLTDRQTGRQETDRLADTHESFGSSIQTFQESLQKISERYLIQNRRYLYIGLISVRILAN